MSNRNFSVNMFILAAMAFGCSNNNLIKPCQTACEFYNAVGPCRVSKDCNYVQELDVSALTEGFFFTLSAFPFQNLEI